MGLSQRAIQSVQQYGGAKPGFRTMLDALVPACETLKHAQEQGHNFKEAIQAAVSSEKKHKHDLTN